MVAKEPEHQSELRRCCELRNESERVKINVTLPVNTQALHRFHRSVGDVHERDKRLGWCAKGIDGDCRSINPMGANWKLLKSQ